MEDDEGLSHSERLDRILADVKKETKGRRRSTKRRSTKRTSKRRSTKRTSKRRSGKRRSVRKTSPKVHFGTDGDEAMSLTNVNQLKNVPLTEIKEVSKLIWGNEFYLKGKIKSMIDKDPNLRNKNEKVTLSLLFKLRNFYDENPHLKKQIDEQENARIINLLSDAGMVGDRIKTRPLKTPMFLEELNQSLIENPLLPDRELPIRPLTPQQKIELYVTLPEIERNYIKQNTTINTEDRDNLVKAVSDWYKINKPLLPRKTPIAQELDKERHDRLLDAYINKQTSEPVDLNKPVTSQPKRESLSQMVIKRLSNLRQGVRQVDPEQLKSLQPQPIKVGEYKHEHIDENDDGYV